MQTQVAVSPSVVEQTDKKTRMKLFLRYMRKNGPLFLLMAPGLIHLFLIQYMPMFGMVIAFKKYRAADGIFGSQWIGLENFKYLFGSEIAWRITFNTVFMNFLFIVVGTLAALTLAILLNEIYTSKFTQGYQVTLFLPFFVGTVILGYFAMALFRTEGLVNTTLKSFDIPAIAFYLEPSYWRYILVGANLWGGVGFGTILYLSGIIGISPEYYEAAEIDGANKWQQIMNITLPSIRFLIIIQVLLAVGKIFFGNFGLFYFVPQLYKNGQLLPVADVIDTFVFRVFQGMGGYTGGVVFNLGMAAAAGFYQSVVGFILVLLTNLLIKKISPDNALL
jgi:putative aldouronate transport system permease protein